MARIMPDDIHGQAASLQEGETVQAEFRADRTAYWRGHLILAVVLGAAAGLFLMLQGNPYPVAGPFGAAIAIAARAAYLASRRWPKPGVSPTAGCWVRVAEAFRCRRSRSRGPSLARFRS